ncbi:hypothetical protein K438DRAFT_1847442 [Mycena galopus ATCC 62051]|nr:hypothetical protein K438DRAFT_1847442 [Mycena galopus ATCC 62051]
MAALGRRTLRSGKEFSEFDLAVGQPLAPRQYFSVADCLKERLAAQEVTRIFDEDIQSLDLPVTSSPISHPPLPSACTVPPPFWVAPDPSPPKIPTTALDRKKLGSKKRKRLKREREAATSEDPDLKAIHLKRRNAAKHNVLPVDLDATDLAHTQPSWIGKRQAEDGHDTPDVTAPLATSLPADGMGPQIYTQEQVDALSGTEGFMYVPWLGATTVPVIDSHRRLIILLGGKPKDITRWNLVTDGAAHLMDSLFHRAHFKPEDSHHRRAHPDSPYFSICRGLSMGGGQGEPGELHNHPDNVTVSDEMLDHEYFRRMVGFTNCLMLVFAPILYMFCQSQNALLAARNKALRWPFLGSVFAACTFNFGPRAITCPHLDFGNLAWSWCAITSLGWFDPDRGGHLILWDLKLVVRFPPGATILIPSAIIRHSNIPVQAHEKRFSFVQYSAGGLFRWIRNGFMTDEDFEKNATKEEKDRRTAEAATRWQEGVGMFSVVDL